MPRGDITYRSSARRAHAAVWLFRAVAVVGVLYAAASLWRLSQFDPLVVSIAAAPRGLLLSTAALGLVALLAVAVRLCAMIAFMVWLYRVTKNLPALGVRDPGVTPGWAIGCWFVPFVNIIAPCIVVLRVWRASGPESAAGSSDGAQGWPLLYAWWGAFILLSGAGLAVWFARPEAGLGAGRGLLTQAQVWAYFCSGIASIAMALLAVGVIREIERRQTEKSQLQAFA
jgi:uncharacterized protein DUF4328